MTTKDQLALAAKSAANALECFYVATPEDVAKDVNDKVRAYITLLEQELSLAQIPTTVDAVEREEWRQERESLLKQLTEARKDTEMLDLIDRKLREEWEIFNSETAWFVGCCAADTLRQAITLAMKERTK